MTVSSGKHYGVEIILNLQGYEGSCGVANINGFAVRGDEYDAAKLTKVQRNKLYRSLMHNVLQHTSKGIMIASDAVDGWSGGNAGGGGRRKADVTFESFLEYFGFQKTKVAKNPNSGNGIRMYTKVLIDHANPSNRFKVGKPKFPAPKPKKSAANYERRALIEEIRALLNA